jgi:protein-tyrosine phosphatase
MASILRQIVAGPRAKHQETGLDLCYVTSNIIATSVPPSIPTFLSLPLPPHNPHHHHHHHHHHPSPSSSPPPTTTNKLTNKQPNTNNPHSSGPSQTYPQLAYRNPLDRLVAFLDAKHADGWAVWEFRAEGTGYPDEAVYGRIRHYPWPDHHPPPFGLVPGIVGGMRVWLGGGGLDRGGGGAETGGGEGAAGGGGVQVVGGEGDQGALGVGVGESGGSKGKGGRVVVVHCKAGKGRSGTMACSYLIAECGWTPEDALARFTERRMRPGFGAGVSIPSQLRWVSYVDRWTKGGKRYVDRPVEIVEVHVWGLRNGVKVAVEGFAEEGKKIRVFHTFKGQERIVVEPGAPGGKGMVAMVQDMAGFGLKAAAGEKGEVAEDANYEAIAEGPNNNGKGNGKQETPSRSPSKRLKGSRTTGLMGKLSGQKAGSAQSLDKLSEDGPRSKTIAMPQASQATSSDASLPGKDESRSQSTTSLQNSFSFADSTEPGGQAVIFKPSSPIRIPNSDVNISLERRNRGPASMGLTMVTAVAHVWFNTFFEGNGPEQDSKPDDSGVFEIEWDKMDGIKGSSQRGTRALDRLSVVWRVAGAGTEEEKAASGVAINEPGENSPVPQMQAADWKGGNAGDPTAEKRLGLRVEDPESRDVSKASSVKSQEVGGGSGAAKEGDDGDDRAS